MEEERKNNKKVLYLVLGIVLSVGLAIGGTAAYFSASKTATGTQITGTTNDISGLSITTARVNLSPNPAPASDDLVPADFGVTPNNMTTTEVNRALTNKCVNNGYTGCHVWKITASSAQTIPSANIELSLSLIDVEDKDEWAYIVYEGTDTSSSNIGHKGNIITDFPNGASVDIHNGGSITGGTPKIYYVMVYLNNTDSAQNDGVTSGTTDARGTYNGTVTLEAMGGKVKALFVDTAVEYITNLYTSASKSTVTNNSITYNYAPSESLMNDRLGSMSTDINGGNIRYYGANPNNYIDIGDKYETSVTQGNWVSAGVPFADETACNDWATEQNITNEQIAEVTNNEYTTVSNFCSTSTIPAGTPILWRIIGVFNGKLRIRRKDSIGAYSFDTSDLSVNGGWGINQWGPSGSYEGADLMRLLNPGYESNSVNNSLYWTSGNGTCYNGSNNSTTPCNFANTGLSTAAKKYVVDQTLYLGGFSSTQIYANVAYSTERGSNVIQNPADNVTRTLSWTGKVGLIYPSDYGYAADFTNNNCKSDLATNSENCTATWMRGLSWMISPWAADPYDELVVASDGFYNGYADGAGGGWPVLTLSSDALLETGDGSESTPYVLAA